MIILIKGIKYKVKLLKKLDYIKKYKDTSYAHVDREDREILFRDDKINKKYVIHEVTHAFINSLHLGSCNDLTLDDFEEIICELMEDHITDIVSISNMIYKHLKEQTNGSKGRKKRK
jgi:hypothetical protein